jgi:SAM-dependent methyltransferase
VTDAIGRLIGLGRTEFDRALLRQALLDLDTNDGLAAKMTAEPMLGDVMAEFIGRLVRAYGSLAAIRNQVVLDIACGSNSSRSPVTGRRTVAFEPWMCRLLAALGARPVGLDIGDLDRERFEHHYVDLGIPGALDFLASASFDAIHESRLFGSPEFRSAYGAAYDRVRKEITRQEARLLKPAGILIHSDAYGRAPGRR